jgi:hypothetical protein
MNQRTSYGLFVALIALVLATVTGCTISDKQLLVVLVEEWTRSKNMSPTKEDGSIDPFGLANGIGAEIKNAVGMSTGDDEVDAILGAKKVLDNLAKAEKLMEEGSKEHNPSKIDEAIQLRPADFTYRARRAAFALADNDLKTAVKQLDAGDSIPKPTKRAQRLYLDTAIRDLEGAEGLVQEWKSVEQCWLLYTTLAAKYDARADLVENPADNFTASIYRNKADQCH